MHYVFPAKTIYIFKMLSPLKTSRLGVIVGVIQKAADSRVAILGSAMQHTGSYALLGI